MPTRKVPFLLLRFLWACKENEGKTSLLPTKSVSKVYQRRYKGGISAVLIINYCLLLLFIRAKPKNLRLSCDFGSPPPEGERTRNGCLSPRASFRFLRTKGMAGNRRFTSTKLSHITVRVKQAGAALDLFGSFSGNGKKNIHETCIMDSGSSPE